MIVLHQPPPAWGLPNVSPFCVKLETYLRMAKIDYKAMPGDIMKAPKERVPYIEVDGGLMGDSTLIIEYLKKRFGDPLDAGLSREQQAHAMALQRMVEDHLYFAAAWLRWSDEASFKFVHDFFRPLMPPVIGGLVLKLVRKGFIAMIREQGMGKHTRDEIIAFAKADLTAISDLLGDKPFFLGDHPTSLDATMYGFLIQQIWIPWDSPVKRHGLALGNLSAYCDRMKQRYWS